MKRGIYRDSKKRIIGGVCSGLGYYIGIDRVLLRLIFIFSIFFFGLTIPLYLILWAIIPKARTEEELAEMKGNQTSSNATFQSFTEGAKESVNKASEEDEKVVVLKEDKPVSTILGGIFIVLSVFLFVLFTSLLLKFPLAIEALSELGWVNSNFVTDLVTIPFEFSAISFTNFLLLLIYFLPIAYFLVIGISVLKSGLAGERKLKNRLLLIWVITFIFHYLL